MFNIIWKCTGLSGNRLTSPITTAVIGMLFWDCLTNLVRRPVHIEIIGIDVIRRKFGDAADKLLEILKEFKHYEDDEYASDIQIELVSGSVRVNLE